MALILAKSGLASHAAWSLLSRSIWNVPLDVMGRPLSCAGRPDRGCTEFRGQEGQLNMKKIDLEEVGEYIKCNANQGEAGRCA